MAQFTTTTVTYSLVKYSRSYPTTTSSQVQPTADAEWQHFVHPVINLYLDAKKSSAGQLVSVRFRIVWDFDTGTNNADVNQREITLEDLDLLSFSSLPGSGSSSDHGLPLKAVYRDAVVGIRYLHPRTPDSTRQPVYRRFQITFATATNAAQFIDAVRPVCPCKLNPQPSMGIRTPTVAMAGHLSHRTATALASNTLQQPPSSTILGQTSAVLPSDLPSSDSVLPTFAPSTPNRFAPVALSSSSVKSTSGAAPSNDSTFFTPPEVPRVPILKASQGQAPSGSVGSTKSSLPDSSQPSSSNSINTMPPPPLPPRSHEPGSRPSDHPRTQLLSSLRDTPALYNLSHAELESMVAQVIREEGFGQLLASLDTLWRVKGLLG